MTGREERGFDEQDIAPRLGPGDARRNTRTRDAKRDFVVKSRRAQIAGNRVGMNGGRLYFLGRCRARGDLPGHGTDLTLEVSHARLARIVCDDSSKRVVVYRDR